MSLIPLTALPVLTHPDLPPTVASHQVCPRHDIVLVSSTISRGLRHSHTRFVDRNLPHSEYDGVEISRDSTPTSINLQRAGASLLSTPRFS